MTRKRIEYYAGIDILRVLAMLYIITIHTLRHGGILDTVEVGSLLFYIAYAFLTVVNVGVDVFAIISGFVGYQKECVSIKWKNLISLWLVVTFYSIVFTSLGGIFNGSLSLKAYLYAITPLTSQTYWYFSAYFFVLILSPYMNTLVEECNGPRTIGTLIVGISMLYFSHRMEGFFAPALLLYLYLVGAIIKKYKLHEYVASKILLWCILLLYLLVFGWKIFFSNMGMHGISNLLLKYDSPLLIIISAMWVLLFIKKETLPSNKKIILKWLTPSVFSVYLLNDHPVVRERIISRIIPDYIFLITYDAR